MTDHEPEPASERAQDVDSAADRPLPPPRPVPERAQELIAWFQQIGGPFGVPSSIGDKVSGQHVSEIIQNQENESVREFEDRGHTRWHQRFLAVLAAVFALLLIGTLVVSGDADLTGELVRILIVSTGVGFGGWGIAQRGRRRE